MKSSPVIPCLPSYAKMFRHGVDKSTDAQVISRILTENIRESQEVSFMNFSQLRWLHWHHHLVWSKWRCFDICFNLKYSLLKFPTLPFNSSTWSWTGCGWHSRGCPGYCAEGCVKQRKQRNDGLFLSLEVLWAQHRVIKLRHCLVRMEAKRHRTNRNF